MPIFESGAYKGPRQNHLFFPSDAYKGRSFKQEKMKKRVLGKSVSYAGGFCNFRKIISQNSQRLYCPLFDVDNLSKIHRTKRNQIT